MDLLYICYDDTGRYRSKGLFDNNPTHAYDFKVKVTDFEILTLMLLRVHIFQTIWWIGFIFDTTIDTGPKWYQ